MEKILYFLQRLCKYHASHHTFTHWFYLPSLICSCDNCYCKICLMVILCFSHCFTLNNWNSIIYYCQYGLTEILFYCLKCSTIIIWLQLWSLEALSGWLLGPFDMSHPFLALLCSLAPKMSRIIYCPYPSSLLKEHWFLLLKNCRVQDLGTRYAHFYWDVTASRRSQRTEWGNNYVK